MVESCLEEWNIEGIFTLTVDNTTSNDVAISYLKEATNMWKGAVLGDEFVHVRCCAHILNLIMTDGLKHHNKSIDRVCHVIRYVKASPNRLQTFKRCVEKLKIESKAILCLDVATRWNFTYKMLEMPKSLNMHSSGWNMKILIIFYTFEMGIMIGDLQMRMIGRLVENLLSF